MMNEAEEWYFTGDPQKRYFSTKMEAETATHKQFSEENARQNYARIYFRPVLFMDGTHYHGERAWEAQEPCQTPDCAFHTKIEEGPRK